MTPDHRQALDAFARAVHEHYGMRLHRIFVFGSRARGDHSPESDLDAAVIVGGHDLQFWAEKRVLTDFAYDALIASGLHVHPWPISKMSWDNPETDIDRDLIESMKGEAKPLAMAQ
jgi:predicted nucleotidyltransferase